MFPIRVKTVQESDLRMLGSLARNIQRVLPVTQADIDAAAALGKGWVVWKVFEVSDPLDNMHGGTQLIIRQNSVQPGQNVRRVIFVSGPGGQTVVIRGTDYIVLPDAIADSLSYVKAFGGTQQGEVPQGYTQLTNITNSSAGYLDTGIIADVDDMEFDVVAKINDVASVSWYILQSRASSSAPIYGISGSASGNTFIGSFSGTNVSAGSTIVRQSGHTYHVNSKCKNGTITLTVEDLTDSTSTTNTGTYTFTAGTTNIGLFRNLAGGNLSSGNTSVISAYVKKGGVKVLDYVPALNPSNVVGFYDKATGTFKVSTGGGFVADQTIVPTPTAPIDIISNNGVLKYSANIANVNAQTALVGYYISAAGVVTADIYNWIYQDFIPVSPNTTYTLTMSQSVYYISISEYSTASDSGFVIRKPGATGTNTTLTITTGATTNFVRFGANLDRTSVTLAEVLAINWQLNKGNSMPYQPYVEGGLYTDGAVETINVHGKNLLNQATEEIGYIDSSGNVIDTGAAGLVSRHSALIPVTVSNTYVFSGKTADGISTYNKRVHGYDSNGTWVQQISFTQAQQNSDYSVIATVPTGVAYIKLSYNSSDTEVQLELGSTATAYQPYYDGGTATAEMLLKVGDYKDVQEIISGAITRNVGVKVLDGTEGWVQSAATNNLFYAIISNSNTDNTYVPISSHFQGVVASTGYATMANGQFKHGSNTNSWYFKNTDCATAAEFSQFVASQYNAGTPVIILYPLATATTESVAGQTLQVTDGDNTLEITQASLIGLELEVEYNAAVSLTIQEVQDANLDNNVTVTIQ